MNIIIFGPAWGTLALLELLVKFLKALGHNVSIAPMHGHYGDTNSVEGQTLQSYIKQAAKHLEERASDGKKIFLVGISMGAVIAHHLANQSPEKVCGVVMYGSPMLGGPPKWSTLFRAIFNPRYWPILKGKGSVTLSPADGVDFLFGGLKGLKQSDLSVLSRTLEQPESASALKELMLGVIQADRHSQVRYTVIVCDEEFHDNRAAVKFAGKHGSRRANSADFVYLPSSHFGLLSDKSFFSAIQHAIAYAEKQEEKTVYLLRPVPVILKEVSAPAETAIAA